MAHGVTVYAPDGVTEIFNSATRTFKKVAIIPFGYHLRKTTQYIKNPLFLTETPVWFFSYGETRDNLLTVTFTGDTAKVVVDTFYRSNNRDGSNKYEDTDMANWTNKSDHVIVLGVY